MKKDVSTVTVLCWVKQATFFCKWNTNAVILGITGSSLMRTKLRQQDLMFDSLKLNTTITITPNLLISIGI